MNEDQDRTRIDNGPIRSQLLNGTYQPQPVLGV
jgi:hypothetical protein